MLTADQCVLVIVDVQGKLAQTVAKPEQLQQQLHSLIAGAQLFALPILWLEQLPDKLGATSAPLKSLLEQSGAPMIKQHFSAWRCDEFVSALSSMQRKQVLLAGIETHICVYQTCCDLLAEQYQVHLVADAMSSRSTDNHHFGLQMMQTKGAALTNVESLLFELQHLAQGERFKALLKLIK
ncbi:MAG: hydrolase [Shewanella sp.]